MQKSITKRDLVVVRVVIAFYDYIIHERMKNGKEGSNPRQLVGVSFKHQEEHGTNGHHVQTDLRMRVGKDTWRYRLTLQEVNSEWVARIIHSLALEENMSWYGVKVENNTFTFSYGGHTID